MKSVFKELKEYSYFMMYMAKTELKAEVANSYLNWVWWVLEPLLNMLVYYYVFNDLMGNKEQYFIVFIYSALIMWNFFNRVITYSIRLVRTNKDIVTKVYIPKYVLLVSNILMNAFKFLLSAAILVVLMLVFQVPVDWHLLYLLPVYLVFAVFTFGCAAILLHFGVFIDDLGYAMGILLNMLFFLSGVFGNLQTMIQGPLGKMLLCFNPIAFFINAMRQALLYKAAPDIGLFVIWTIISVALCGAGVALIRKYENTYVKII